MAKEAKTNAMRMLERAKVTYTSHEYPHEEGQAVDGANVARLTGQDPARVFKTLVTQGADRNYYVFVVPVLAALALVTGSIWARSAWGVWWTWDARPPYSLLSSSTAATGSCRSTPTSAAETCRPKRAKLSK